MIRVWVVRLGTGGELVDLCKEKGLMAIGWHEIGELTQFNDYENLRNKVYETYRNRYSAPGSAGVAAGMLWTFLTKINEGDIVLSPKNETREVLIGFVNGKYHYNPDAIDSMHPNTRNVQWKLYVPIDKLPSDMWRSMSAWQTLFELTSEEAIRTAHKLFEIETSGQGHIGPDVIEDPRKRAIDEGTRLFLETNKMAYQILATHFESFSGLEFQEVVSATLKAAGLFPKPIKSGADQGIDIEVYRDPLQLGPPRIIVQVKHRQGTVSGPEMRQFLGTMNREGDVGLFVSTGGFGKEAKIAAEKSHRPLRLMGWEEFIDLFLTVYDRLTNEYKAQIPLSTVRILFQHDEESEEEK